MSDSPGIRIRRAKSQKDWEAIRKINCLTGHLGQPISDARWPFFAEQWIGPYQSLPSLSYVAEKEGEILGYLTAASHTPSFERKRKLFFDWPLVGRVLIGKFKKNGDTKRFVKRALGWESGPEQSFPKNFLKNLKSEYPAHLHMNVDEKARGMKIGAMLVDRLKSDLMVSGVHGVHLFCGDQPIPFYQKQGFSVLHRIEFKPQVFVYALGVRF